MKGTALVLGGRTGLLGQALKRVLSAHGWNVRTLGREDGDLLNADFLRHTVETAAPDVIFNTVAWTQVDDAEANSAAVTHWNRALPAELARLVKDTTRHLLHFSTDFVFSGNKGEPYTEEDTPDPTTVYGTSKLAGERAVLEIAPNNSCIVRTAWLFGPGRKNFVSTILEACRKRDTITVVHDQIGSPTYSLDLALWSMLLAEKKATGIVHAANGGRASWCELACEAVSLSETPCRVDPISSAQWPQKAKRPPLSVLNTNLLAFIIGQAPRPWPQALRDYLYTDCLNRDTEIRTP